MNDLNQQYPVIDSGVPVIERNVPIPKTGPMKSKVDWVKQLEVGDSVVVDYSTAQSVVSKGKALGFKMIQRKLESDKSFKESKTRVWRVE